MATKITLVKRLIINADDFGRHKLINCAVEKAHREGCLRSTTIMAGGKAFDDAIEVARRNPDLGVGIHFTLANGYPVLPPNQIPTLVNADGIFHENYIAFLKLYIAGKISHDEIKAELAAQIEKVIRSGIKLTHFDSHQHLHHFPGIIGLALDLASDAKIPAMRVADTKIFDGNLESIGQFVGRLGLGTLAKVAAHLAHKRNIATPEHFAGIVAGESVSESYLCNLIENLREGITEVMIHPGINDKILREHCDWQHSFEEELNAVTSAKILSLIAQKNISVINFRELSQCNATG